MKYLLTILLCSSICNAKVYAFHFHDRVKIKNCNPENYFFHVCKKVGLIIGIQESNECKSGNLLYTVDFDSDFYDYYCEEQLVK